MEDLGIAFVAIGGIAAVVAAGVMFGWPWSLAVAAVLLIPAGIVLIRTAALTPPKPSTPEGSEVS